MQILRLLLFMFSLGLLPLPAQAVSTVTEACVIVLHGLGRTHYSMGLIEEVLAGEGYLVWNQGYPSRSDTVEQLATAAIDPALGYCRDNRSGVVHFVTHSLGGILVRQYLQKNTIDELGRIVMLSPPNHGSEVVDMLKNYFLYQAALGPAAQQVGTDAGNLPEKLGPISGEIGIIAGRSTSDPWFSSVIPGDDDGKVSVESAKLDEMSDFLIVENGHTFIMRDKTVIKQVVYFLGHGKFNREQSQ